MKSARKRQQITSNRLEVSWIVGIPLLALNYCVKLSKSSAIRWSVCAHIDAVTNWRMSNLDWNFLCTNVFVTCLCVYKNSYFPYTKRILFFYHNKKPQGWLKFHVPLEKSVPRVCTNLCVKGLLFIIRCRAFRLIDFILAARTLDFQTLLIH